jgi:hypothetical protein
MSISAFRYPSHSPAPHRPEPMREGLAWWHKIHLSCLPPQRKTGGICFETGRLGEVIIRQTSLLVRSNSRATTQIPIARRLS